MTEMGHMIQGCIGNENIINEFHRLLKDCELIVEELPQQYYLLYLTDSLYDCFHTSNDSEQDIEPFDYLNHSMKQFFERISLVGDFVYIETDYFGGVGAQSAGVFQDGQLRSVFVSDGSTLDTDIPYPERLKEEPINQVLRTIGVERKKNLDEFDTLCLGNYRHMPYNEI